MIKTFQGWYAWIGPSKDLCFHCHMSVQALNQSIKGILGPEKVIQSPKAHNQDFHKNWHLADFLQIPPASVQKKLDDTTQQLIQYTTDYFEKKMVAEIDQSKLQYRDNKTYIIRFLAFCKNYQCTKLDFKMSHSALSPPCYFSMNIVRHSINIVNNEIVFYYIALIFIL
jgi:hypothetical protein